MTSANTAGFTLTFGDQSLRVLRLEGEEGMSRLPCFRLSLLQPTEYGGAEFIDPEGPPGKSATLRLYGQQQNRQVHGILRRFDLKSVSVSGIEYETELVSSFHPLQLNENCRIFQQKSTPEIVSQLVGEHGLSQQLQWLLSESYPPRDYCVQYQESDWDFIARLLEEEGIFFYFRHEQTDLLVCGDGPHALGEGPTVWLRTETSNQRLYEEALSRFEVGARLCPTRATLRDYRFKSPRVRMETQQSGDDAFQGGELYLYPGEFQDLNVAARLTRVRVGEAQTGGALCRGAGNPRALCPGFFFVLEGHPVPALSRPWLVVSLRHHGEQSQALEAANLGMIRQTLDYRVELEGMPHDQRFVPPRVTPRPRIRGLQSAVVVGPAGETIYTDPWGRVKVRFHWDRINPADETASCWIRPSQAWSGQSFGALFLPRIGHEVLVQFIEGDPDRPVIIGRVYNDLQKVPYKLPERKTVSTFKTRSVGGSGYNELRFEDLGGQEEIFVHGQRDWNIVIEQLKDETIGNDKSLDVGQDHTISIGKNKTESVGMNELSLIGQNRKQQVGRNEQRRVGMNRQQLIGVDDKLEINGKQLTEVKKDEHIQIRNALEVSVKKTSLLKTLDGPLQLSTQDHLGLHAKTYLRLECGESSLTLQSDGTIALMGKKVELKGGAHLMVKGQQVLLNPPSITTTPEEATRSSGSEEPSDDAAAPAPAPAPETPKASPGAGKDPLTDVKPYMDKSPTMQSMWQEASQEGWTVQYGKAGGGSYADRTTKVITIDGNEAGNPAAVTETLSHELGHATYEMPPIPGCSGKSMDQYVAEATHVSLMDEGNATLSNATVQQELAQQGLKIDVAGAKASEYEKVAKDTSKSQEAKCAEIADLFGQYEKTSNTKQNYADYYGSFYQKAYQSGRC